MRQAIIIVSSEEHISLYQRRIFEYSRGTMLKVCR